MCECVTWVDAVAGDVASFQSLGELVGEEHVAQFAAAISLKELPAVPAGPQVFVHRQSLNTQTPSSTRDHLRQVT